MSVLANLEPKDVFYYFEEISKIPRGSGNIEKISDYLVDFAKNHKLEYYQDALKNVILIKEATAGYENQEPIIIQGHMDMVCVKKSGCTKNMETEGLDLMVEGDYIYAKDTSLGGDDGIAVAYGLALLSGTIYQHPRLEVVITVDEETGMEGATGIDLSVLKGKQLLNVDSEEEGILWTSCAGGARVKCILPVTYSALNSDDIGLEVSVTGLLGGHSGIEIHKKRGNAIRIVGEIINVLCKKEIDFSILKLVGGVADNAIASSSKLIITAHRDQVSEIKVSILELEQQIKLRLAESDPDLEITVSELIEFKDDIDHSNFTVYGKKLQIQNVKTIAKLYEILPEGVIAMSANIQGLVETSLNMGTIVLNKDELRMLYAVRSSVGQSKEILIRQLEDIMKDCGGSIEITGDYPAWEYLEKSPLRDKMIHIYQQMYGKTPDLQAIHAGLECGILAGKIKNMDGISFGPNMKDIHTAEERLSISSSARIWDYLLQILASKQ